MDEICDAALVIISNAGLLIRLVSYSSLTSFESSPVERIVVSISYKAVLATVQIFLSWNHVVSTILCDTEAIAERPPAISIIALCLSINPI